MCLDLVLRRLSVILVSFFPLLLLFCFVAAAVLVVILVVAVCFVTAVVVVILVVAVCFVVAVVVVVDNVAGVIDIICCIHCKKTNGTYNQNKWHIICVMCLDLGGGGNQPSTHSQGMRLDTPSNGRIAQQKTW